MSSSTCRIGVIACCFMLASAIVFVGGAAHSQTARSISVTPKDQLTDGQFVAVSVTGFHPKNYVDVRLCAADATSVNDCAEDTPHIHDPGHSRIIDTGSQGEGSTAFIIKAKDIDRLDASSKFQCDSEHPCRLYAFDLDASTGTDDFANGVYVPLGYALSSIPCPETEPRVAGSGASSIRADLVEWQAETCRPPTSLNVSYATNNSVNGKQAFVNGLTDADFAVSGIALTDAEQQALAARHVKAVHVPVALSGLVLVYNMWFDTNGDRVPDQITNLQLSPATVAGIMQGRIGNWADPAIKADNIQNYPNGLPNKRILPVGRADNSAATWWLSSWLYTTARDAWTAGGDSFQGGPTTVFPAGNGVDLRTGTDAVAGDIRFFPGEQGVGDVPDAGLIGFAYESDALKLGLPVVALQNASGNYVKPTADSLNAAVAAGSISSDGVFQPNFSSTDPRAYPMPVVTYAIVPTADSGEPPLDPPHELVLSTFLHYAVGDGQKSADLRGYVPLPPALLSASNAGIGRVYAVPPPTPAPTVGPVAAQPASMPVPAPVTRALDSVAPGLGAVVTGLLGSHESSSAASVPKPPPAPTTQSSPVDRVVSGVLAPAGGGHAPVTVSTLLWFGAIVLVVGRALSIITARREARRNVDAATIAGGAGRWP